MGHAKMRITLKKELSTPINMWTRINMSIATMLDIPTRRKSVNSVDQKNTAQ